MSTEGRLQTFNAIAGADLSAAQYKFVKFSANRTVVVCAAATDKPCGVLQNAPTSGHAAQVAYAGESKIQADAALTAGTLIGTSVDGQADAKIPGTDTTEFICGHVIDGASNAGELISALIDCSAIARGA